METERSILDLHLELNDLGDGSSKRSMILGDLDGLDPRRQRLVLILERGSVESFLGGCILFNMVLLILETDASADDGNVPGWVRITNYILLAMYTIELVLKLSAYRCHFFTRGWNCVDLAIVSSDLSLLALDLIIGNMPKIIVLRAFRLVRLARTFKALSMFPDLLFLLRGVVGAFRAIFWGISLILVVITIWAILAVQLIHPINKELTESGFYARSGCDRCPHAFESVWMSILTLFQTMVAGDEWGSLALPITEKSPLAGLFFLIVFVTVSLAMMNLILAVMIDHAQDVKAESVKRVAREKHNGFKKAVAALVKMWNTLDVNGDQHITKEELLRGFASKDFARIMQTMGLRVRDIGRLFDVLDEDSSGSIDSSEFIGQLFRMKDPDLHFITMELLDLKQRLSNLKQTNTKDESHASMNMVHVSDWSPQQLGNSEGVQVEVQDSGKEKTAHMQHPGEPKATLEAAQDHRHGPEEAMSELAASVHNLVSHAELHSRMLGNICDALMCLPPGHTSSKLALGAYQQRPLACKPGKLPAVQGWQALNPPNLIGKPNEAIKPQASRQLSTKEENGVTPQHVEQVGIPLMTLQTPQVMPPKSPRVTSPRSSLEISQLLRRARFVPLQSNRYHSPTQSPREYSAG